MKGAIKIGLVSTLLLIYFIQAKAQSSSGFYVSATIVNPVGVNSFSMNEYTDVPVNPAQNRLKNESNKLGITAAVFSVDAAVADVYSISLPTELELCNSNGYSRITALLNPLPATQCLPNGQKQYLLDSELVLNNAPVTGKHSSTPFEITVNFN